MNSIIDMVEDLISVYINHMGCEPRMIYMNQYIAGLFLDEVKRSTIFYINDNIETIIIYRGIQIEIVDDDNPCNIMIGLK